MMGCDMCGNSGQLYVTSVEGVDMELCSSCKGYGEVRRLVGEEPVRLRKRAPRKERLESQEIIVSGFGARIKDARERQGLKQSELASRLALKESQLHSFESGAREPTIETARRLERALGVVLVEESQDSDYETVRSSGGSLTIGDMLKK